MQLRQQLSNLICRALSLQLIYELPHRSGYIDLENYKGTITQNLTYDFEGRTTRI